MFSRYMKLSILFIIIITMSGCSDINLTRRPMSNRVSRGVRADTARPSVFATTGTNTTNRATITNNPQIPVPARTMSLVSLYGEMIGSSKQLPNDELANLNQITFTHEGADFDVDIDPTGRFMVYASTRHRKTSDLYMKNVDGSTITQLTSDPSDDTMPAISPDGSMIAFCSNRSGNWDIYVKDLIGSNPVKVTDTAMHELHPSWSPDGQSLIFSCLSQQSGQWEMVVVNLARPAQRKAIGYGLFPSFSPDGNKIVFQRSRARGQRWFSVWTIDYINGDGVRPTEIAASMNAAVISPSWSPDGRQLVFATVVNPAGSLDKRPYTSDLWKINIDGSGRTRLTTDRYVNLQPRWSSNGNIYFVSNRSGKDNVWALRAGRSLVSDGQVVSATTANDANSAKNAQVIAPATE